MKRRTYHLIDLENHLGGTAWDAAAVDQVARDYEDALHPESDDLMVVVVSPKLGFAAKDAFPHAQLKVARGKDAADLELIYHEPVDWLAARFDRVVIASGDFIFTGLAVSLRLAGVHTTVVARRDSASRFLLTEVDDVVWLPDHGSTHVLDLTDRRRIVVTPLPYR
jgi:hypothetical protein